MKKFSSYQKRKRCSQHPGKLEFSLYLTQISCGWTIPFVCRSFPLTRENADVPLSRQIVIFHFIYNTNFQWLDYRYQLYAGVFLLPENADVRNIQANWHFSLYITKISSGWTIPFVCRSFPHTRENADVPNIQTNCYFSLFI